MGEAQEKQLQIMVQGETEEKLSVQHNIGNQPTVTQKPNYSGWIRIAIHTFFVLSGQAAAILLGRQYYEKGGNSKWVVTFVQLAGFPILIPYYCIPPTSKIPNSEIVHTKRPSVFVLAAVYISIGLLMALDCFLYSVGLQYLPVSTTSLICASQLAFNSCFSFFLNGQKFTPYVINSLVLLTISSTLLVFNNDSEKTTGVSKGKYVIGFIFTVCASAGYGLVLSLTQLAFNKVIKRKTFKAIMDMALYPNFIASCAALLGLVVSREVMNLKREMEEYELGKVSYLMNLVWTAITWQLFAVGSTGLIFETSSLFTNAITVLGLPIVPILAVVFFHDKMNGLKVMSMLLATWGFVSFAYQHYVDDHKSKSDSRRSN